MSGLFAILRNSAGALSNFQVGLGVIQDNIASAGTPGHTVKRLIFSPSPPILMSFGALGTGALISRVEGARNAFIEGRLISELQSQGFFEGQRFGLQQIEGLLFSGAEEGLSGQISRFFNSFSDLTTDGESLPLRQAVLGEARNLAEEFRSANERLGRLALDNRQQIEDTVQRINLLTRRIADLNTQTAHLKAQGLDGGTFQDQRQAALDELAQLIDFQVIEEPNGMVQVLTRSGQALVSRDRPHQLSTSADSSGMSLSLGGRDITGGVQGGRLGGYLTLDRETIPSYLADLDQLAQELAERVNAALLAGEDLQGQAGQPLFSFTPGAAASTLKLAFDDAALLAAATASTGPGNVGIAQQIVDLRSQSIAALGDDTFSGFFSQIVFRAGLEGREVLDSLAAQSAVVVQTQQERDSVSGVSLDEEAVKLIQLQRSYEASARVVQIVDQLLEETMNLIR